MKQLNYEIRRVFEHNADGSYNTQADRADSLDRSARELAALGPKVVHPKHLKPKHIHMLVQHWMSKSLAPGTIKNRMSHLRWLVGKVNNARAIKPDNAYYGIPDRQHVDGDRSVDFLQSQIDAIPHQYIRVSAELQKHFGLRREEAMKFMPGFADRKDRIVLKPAWAKGGRGREIPITTDAQRRALSMAHALAGQSSLIPRGISYYAHCRLFEKHMSGVGLGRTHGARHAYAQKRYEELTGALPAAKGGLSRRQLTPPLKAIDTKARQIISAELGHERIEIVAVYLGG